jgi:predicted PurR-regulated permease PerM
LYPTPWQKKTLWNAITAVSLLVIAAIFVFAIYVATRILTFLQPFLLPVAVAAVLAFLLEPVVSWLTRRRLPRLLAVTIVFGAFVLGAALLVVGVIPSIYSEGVKFSSTLPAYVEKGWGALDGFLQNHIEIFPQLGIGHSTSNGSNPEERGVTPESKPADTGLARYRDNPYIRQSLQYLQEQLPSLFQRSWAFAQSSLTGVFGVFGFLFGLLVIPIYLFFFLKESP